MSKHTIYMHKNTLFIDKDQPHRGKEPRPKKIIKI
jgi:hypothetical protein